MTDPFEWDARRYGALPLPHVAWGRGVLDRLEAPRNARVLDLGCGTGRDARALLDERPDLRLIGIDGSRQMLTAAEETLAAHAGRVELRQADLRESHDVGTVAAAYTVATLHWLPDHAPAFTSVARGLVRGGRFVADAGGAGNLARLNAAIETVFGPGETWNFAGIEETAAGLRAAGFDVLDVRLRAEPLVLTPETYRPYLQTVVLGSHLRPLAESDRADAVAAVADAMGEPVVDYVRLEFEAARAALPAPA